MTVSFFGDYAYTVVWVNLTVNEEHPETYRETFCLSELKKSIARMSSELKSREEKAVKFENVNSLRCKQKSSW